VVEKSNVTDEKQNNMAHSKLHRQVNKLVCVTETRYKTVWKKAKTNSGQHTQWTEVLQA